MSDVVEQHAKIAQQIVKQAGNGTNVFITFVGAVRVNTQENQEKHLQLFNSYLKDGQAVNKLAWEDVRIEQIEENVKQKLAEVMDAIPERRLDTLVKMAFEVGMRKTPTIHELPEYLGMGQYRVKDLLTRKYTDLKDGD